MQSDLEAVFELVDSVRADQDSRIHTLAAEIEKMRALVEQSLGHSIDLMRSEISSTLSEMHRTTEIGQSELRTDLQRARRETTLKFEQLRQEVRAQRDEFKQDLLPLQSLVTGTATPEARRPKDRKNVEAKLKEDIASAQKKEEAAAIDSRLETAVASVRAEMAQQLNQHFLVVDNRIVTELAALALKVQASLHEMDKKWERAIADTRTEVRLLREETTIKYGTLVANDGARRETDERVARGLKALSGEVAAVHRACEARARDMDDLRQTYDQKILAMLAQGQRASKVFHEVEGAIARLEARLDRHLPP